MQKDYIVYDNDGDMVADNLSLEEAKKLADEVFGHYEEQ